MTRWRAPLLALVLVALGGVAVAASGIPGWSEGTKAKGTARSLQGMEEPIEVNLPDEVAARIEGPTFLVYFSPTCPHCQHAQPELNALAKELRGKASFLGIASGAVPADRAQAYQRDYKVTYPIVHDADRQIASAMGARSTPSILFVDRKNKKTILGKDAWYPYRRGTGTLLAMRVMDNPWDAFGEGEYHGIATCAGCHIEETEAWMLSHHSIAWETLLAHDADKKAECVGCHVTGMGAATGWSLDDPAPNLVDVGCEACHGPGGPHDGVPTKATETCAGCHDAKHSIAFSVEKGLPHIDHYAANNLDDAAFRDRLRSLHTGESDKPLLAFSEGPHVGSETCKTCHESEHAWWGADSHANAMASLQGKEHEGAPAAGQVACVRCHASPKSHGGPTPTAMDAFLPDEGVGCESCHGPGGEHVASKGAPGTIEGLGDDCPVCVLESLCTSCHTTEWDSSWNLDKRLGQVKHVPPGATNEEAP